MSGGVGSIDVTEPGGAAAQDHGTRHTVMVWFGEDGDADMLTPCFPNELEHAQLSAVKSVVAPGFGLQDEAVEVAEVIVDNAFDFADEFFDRLRGWVWALVEGFRAVALWGKAGCGLLIFQPFFRH